MLPKAAAFGRSRSSIALTFFVLLTALGRLSAAATIYGTPAPLTGSRVVAAVGLATTEADWQNAAVDWNIIYNNDSTWTYNYTFTLFGRPAISHIDIDISDDAVNDPNVVTNATLNGVDIQSHVELGNKDGITGVAKFDQGADDVGADDFDPLTISFVSNRSPVYGDLYIKGGQTQLTNTGFSDHSLMDPLHFIARPNGVIPEPTSTFLLSIGLALCGAARWRRI